MKMKKIECLGIVGRFPTPNGLRTYYDTGRKLSPTELAEAIVLQHSMVQGIGDESETVEQLFDYMTRVINKANVYPIGYGALIGDGRIIVTEPWFESKEEIGQ